MTIGACCAARLSHENILSLRLLQTCRHAEFCVYAGCRNLICIFRSLHLVWMLLAWPFLHPYTFLENVFSIFHTVNKYLSIIIINRRSIPTNVFKNLYSRWHSERVCDTGVETRLVEVLDLCNGFHIPTPHLHQGIPQSAFVVGIKSVVWIILTVTCMEDK